MTESKYHIQKPNYSTLIFVIRCILCQLGSFLLARSHIYPGPSFHWHNNDTWQIRVYAVPYRGKLWRAETLVNLASHHKLTKVSSVKVPCSILNKARYSYKYKKSNLRKEVGIAVRSKETSSQLKPVKNSHV